MPPYAAIPISPAAVERRFNSLATCWLIYAGLVGLTGLLGLTFGHMFLTGHMGPWNHGFGHRYWNAPEMPFFFFRIARTLLVLKVGLAVAAGVGLLQKARWGRNVAIVAACFALFSFPLGTALGVWTLMILLNGYYAAGYLRMARS